METLDRGSSLALKDVVIAHGFHAENSNAVLSQNRQDFLFETAEVGVHYVEGHLNGIELETVL